MPDQSFSDDDLLGLYHNPQADLSLLTPDEQQRLVHLTSPSGGDQATPPQQTAATPPPNSGSFLDKLGGWRGLAGTGIRMGASVLGSEGMLPGAAINAGGEALAEAVEGSPLSPSRIVSEGVAGGIPFGKVVKGGELGLSALRSGALSGGREALQEFLSGQSLNPTAIGTSGALGAVTGGIGSRFAGPATQATEEAVKPGGPWVVEPTAQTGPGTRVLPPGTVAPSKLDQAIEQRQTGIIAPRPIKSSGQVIAQPTSGAGSTDVMTPPATAYPAPDAGTLQQQATMPGSIGRGARAEIAAQPKPVNQGPAITAFQDMLAGNLGKAIDQAPGAAEGLSDLDSAIAQQQKLGSQTRAANFRADVAATRAEQAADLKTAIAEMKKGSSDTEEVSADLPVRSVGGPPRTPPPEQTVGTQGENIAGGRGARVPKTPPPDMSFLGDTEGWTPAVQEGPGRVDLNSQPTQVNEARADAATLGHEAPPPSPLAQLFNPDLKKPGNIIRTPQGAAALNYRMAQQAAARGEIPSATEAGAASVRESALAKGTDPDLAVEQWRAKQNAEMAGRPQQGVKQAQAPVPTAGSVESSPSPMDTERMQQEIEYYKNNPDILKAAVKAEPAMTTGQPTIFDRFKALAQSEAAGRLGSESGEISPGLTRLLSGMAGAAVGAPIGAYENPDDPLTGALKGGAIGGAMGGWVSPTETGTLGEAGRNLLAVHRASLLANPIAQLKKPIGDIGGVFMEGAKQALPGAYGDTGVGLNLMKEALTAPFRPVNYKNFYKGMTGNPDVGSAIGDVYRSASNSPLGAITLPYAGFQHMTEEMMNRAGETNPEIQKRVLGLNTPDSKIGREALGFIQRNPMAQWAVPFSKLPINVAEGVRGLPVVANYIGGEGAGQQAMVGGGQIALGALEQLYNQAYEEGGEPTSNTGKVLQTVAMGPKGVVPNIIGKALASTFTGGKSEALKELINLIPGMRMAPDMPKKNELAADYLKRQLGNQVDTMAPSILTGESGSIR